MHTVVVRVWLPDRPGALGQVASRIGAVKGDVLGIEILEVGGGRVIDELVVALPDDTLVDLMVNEVHAIDGVSVEHVRRVDGDHSDGGLRALALAAELAEATTDRRVDVLVDGVVRLTEADWVLVVRAGQAIGSIGTTPSPEWITSLLAGSRHLGEPHVTSSDMFWADLPSSGLWLAAGRDGRPVHDRERLRLDLFARIADTLLANTVPADTPPTDTPPTDTPPTVPADTPPTVPADTPPADTPLADTPPADGRDVHSSYESG